MKIPSVRILLLSLLLSACGDTTQARPKALFIIVDGIPADVIESVATPNLDAISKTGGYARAYVGGEVGGETESPTISAVGYNSLLTGTWANKHNVWGNSVVDPDYSYWDIFRIAKHHDPTLTTAVYSTWTDNRTKLIGDGLEAAGGSKLDFYADGYELDTERFPHDAEGRYIGQIDALVVEEAARHLREAGPDLAWIYLEHTDGIAHRYGDSPEQIEAIHEMDAYLGTIWSTIRAREDEHDEDWLLIVTTDHGRDNATGRGHGNQSERERTTWIATNSQRLNQHFNEMPGIVDILPSIATHMNLTIPDDIRAQLDGTSFID